ncbi:polysaccharide biosynthesis protein [Suicoccus acidiformans]|uniref:Polysaccharide biosynthesis protein n=1 Tax=Suicoccus acidiformans TaxID=2036206 RepID=A0A347WJN3_9LACT|nr:nucleoside-diphosphate sugar epimerase/dehydratase [Suicoccus acidiformans]AXY25290.1 polysaccharide biosynthesis protein [Suicoccus acidiformans]
MDSYTNHLLGYIENLSSRQRRIGWMVLDIFCLLLGILTSYFILWNIIPSNFSQFILYGIVTFIAYEIMGTFLKLYLTFNRYSNISTLFTLFLIMFLANVIGGIVMLVFMRAFSIRFIFLTGLISGIMVFALRTLWQLIYSRRKKYQKSEDELERVVVIGAGDGGSIFMDNHIRNPQNLEVIAILDQNPAKHGLLLGGVKILGDIDLLPSLVKEFGVTKVVVAIPTIKPEEYEKILKITSPLKINLYKMPNVEKVVQGTYKPLLTQNRVNIADLLGRQEIALNESKLRKEIEGKVIAITGAGGSIGSEIARQVSKHNPKRVILIGHGENSIYLIYQELSKLINMVEYAPVIADIKDYERILGIFQEEQPDIVYHAAAHKHVPLMEMNPVEAFTNNILGSYNVAKAVDAAKVSKMVMISTDKAVNPPNVMGASKRVAELIVTGFDKMSESVYCAVRFGNVLGSRGSVIPVFEKQIKEGGPVTVTDFRMTRYFMTIPEASQLVIYAGAYAQNGEVFILDMGEPVKILDLARKIILLSGYTEEEIEIVESGIRPGEKLYEELLTSSELVDRQVHEKIFVGKVADIPLSETLKFVESLKTDDSDQLRDSIIQFANNSIN